MSAGIISGSPVMTVCFVVMLGLIIIGSIAGML
ncbi:hypothetical protein SPV1_09098 [Mariprofundus ferrooxydans PV-1]|uniref:Uncharacterized protein n=1 Tax=Mariprofundus ferrooxydans PV-1 TaxID=314345 RepID=Q0F045_9PROT|nr:hypothetical protein SPV1_09098 [Mariprofundus ferrooxydans PV-1]